MSYGAKREFGREAMTFHRWSVPTAGPLARQSDSKHFLQIKGFKGGVPQNPLDKLGVFPERARQRESKGNTETAAVKPRVDSAS